MSGMARPKQKQEYKGIILHAGDGLEILPESKEFNFGCCGCGLVHRIKIEHTKENTVILRFYLNKRLKLVTR